jgi:hypothetical protein
MIRTANKTKQNEGLRLGVRDLIFYVLLLELRYANY